MPKSMLRYVSWKPCRVESRCKSIVFWSYVELRKKFYTELSSVANKSDMAAKVETGKVFYFSEGLQFGTLGGWFEGLEGPVK